MFLFIPATHIRVSVRWPALSKLSGSQNRLDEVLFRTLRRSKISPHFEHLAKCSFFFKRKLFIFVDCHAAAQLTLVADPSR